MHADKTRRIAQSLQLVNSEKNKPVYFHGKTMWPFLYEGDELIVVPIEENPFQVGDIVTFWDGDKFPTKRVIRRIEHEGEVLIRGDNVPLQEFYVPEEDVLGLVVARKRDGKWIYRKGLYWKLFSFWIVKRERFIYKIADYQKLGLLKTIRRFLP